MTRAEAILWDLDGVIVDSGEWHYAAYVKVLATRGVELTRERYYSSLFGRRNWDILRDALGDLSDDEIRRIAIEKEKTFRELVGGHIEPLPGAKELLRRAHEFGLKQSIVSSTPRENIELIVETLGVRKLLEAIVGEEDSERGKPDPQPFTTAADRLGVAYERCVVIEDAPEGIEAGKRAGMRTIGVATTRPVERLDETGADRVVSSLVDERMWRFITGKRVPLSKLRLDDPDLFDSVGFGRFVLLGILAGALFVTIVVLIKGSDLWTSLTWGIPLGILSGFAAAVYGWGTRPRKK